MSVKVKFEMHEGGFFSNFNKVITFLNHFEKIANYLEGIYDSANKIILSSSFSKK